MKTTSRQAPNHRFNDDATGPYDWLNQSSRTVTGYGPEERGHFSGSWDWCHQVLELDIPVPGSAPIDSGICPYQVWDLPRRV